MVPSLKNPLGVSHKFIYFTYSRVLEKQPNHVIINLLLLRFQQVDSCISHQTKLKNTAYLKITVSQQTALIGMHTIFTNIVISLCENSEHCWSWIQPEVFGHQS